MNNYKLIKLSEGYIIVSDEDIKEGDYVYHPEVSKKYTAVDITKKGNDRYTERNYIAQGIYKHIPTTNDWYLKERKIIASNFIPELPNIDFNNLEEEFGIVDINKLTNDYFLQEYSWTSNNDLPYKEADIKNIKKDFKKGFNKCLSLNKDKLYTEQQLKKAFGFYAFVSPSQQPYNEKEFKDAFNVFIQLLQPKTEWRVEVEKYCGTEDCYLFGCQKYEGCKHENLQKLKIIDNKIKITKIL